MPDVNRYPNMQKQRVSRACDTCKRRKIRCTGKLPCAHCIKNNKTCEFKAAYTRGAVPEVQSAPVEDQEKYLEEVGYKRRQVWRPSPSRKNSSHVQAEREDEDVEEEGENVEYDEPTGNGQIYTPPNQTLPSRHTRPPSPRHSGPSLSNAQHARRSTHHRESNCSASASFYERTQMNVNRLDYHQKNPVSAYGDPPLPEIDGSFLIFPSANAAQALLGKYFDFVSATNRLLHRPTVQSWICEFLGSIRGMRTAAAENSHRAVVLMLFASTHEYMDDEPVDWDTGTSFRYFQAAENQLAKETGEIRLATIQARLMQCLYLISRSRINQCNSTFGTVVNFIFTLGIHRERRPSSVSDLLEIEMQKRVFWSAYVLDKYLSSALGRPQMFHDEDIDQPLPLFVEDENISSSSLKTTNKDAQTPMKAAIYQIMLAKIQGNILRELYSIENISIETRFASAAKLTAALRQWRTEIAHFIDLDPSLLSPLYMRQSMALRLSYAHALIILHRPFLLDSFDGHLDIALPVLRAKLEENMNGCLEAALDVIETIDTMYKTEKSFNASWFAHYCAYCAILAVYIYVIRRASASCEASNSNPSSSWMPHFEAASKCQEQIKNSSTTLKESFAQKCSIVLEESRAEAMVKIRQVQSKERNGWGQSGDDESGPSSDMQEERQELSMGARPQVQMEETSFFGGEWNDMNFVSKFPNPTPSILTFLLSETQILDPTSQPLVPTEALNFTGRYLNFQIVWRKVKWMLLTLILPEFFVGKALQDFTRAKKSATYLKDVASNSGIIWTATHGFYADMGGFVLKARQESDGENVPAPIFLNCTSLQFACTGNTRGDKLIEKIPDISEKEIQDKSKGDFFVKATAVIQASWMIVQTIVRGAKGLAVSQLEIAVLAYSACTIITYILCLDKPQNVQVPTVIPVKKEFGGVKLSTQHREAIRDCRPRSWFALSLRLFRYTDLGKDDRDALGPIPNDARYDDVKSLIFGKNSFMTRMDDGFVIAGLVFGSLHCVAWNFDFPTPVEQLLWRISSVVMLPLYYAVLLCDIHVHLAWLRLPLMLTVPLLALAYLLARLFLMAEVFRSLFFLPPSAFITTWSSQIPHVS
ncbi:hypothetical protein EG329_014288 [Mollisiaceae sp. DMI_Dod_QoI]|nr:hypothetical protein EG329_014288 [Helotiales sp. DMI_Dod_QoI]